MRSSLISANTSNEGDRNRQVGGILFREVEHVVEFFAAGTLGSVNSAALTMTLPASGISCYEADWEQSLARETVGNGGQCATAILANLAVSATRNQQVADSRRR